MTDQTNQDNLDGQTGQQGQTGIDPETERRNRENETGEQLQTPTEPTTSEPESGFVGSGGDQSSDYLTKGENEDFQPEDGSDTSTGTADVETGQPTSPDATLDDGSDTSR